jgi:hypothetical protein
MTGKVCPFIIAFRGFLAYPTILVSTWCTCIGNEIREKRALTPIA